jgi:hypothetical protein
MKTGITGITMLAGNVIVLEETLKSFATICDEIVIGDMILFPEDREILHMYADKYPIKIIKLPFYYIFKNGFASVLNLLASNAKNDTVLYLNTSEVIEIDNGILDIVSGAYNCYYFDHATDAHRWFRFYDRRELQWSGRIHEALAAPPAYDFRPYHKPIFRMADLEKDMYSPFKAAVFNSVKEVVYFTNYMSIIDSPDELGATDPGWIKFATENYQSMGERLEAKGDLYIAFLNSDYYALMKSIYETPEFEKQRFESNIGIEYQGDKKYLL